MKRLTAVLAAALITLTLSTTAFAVPENSDKAEQSGTQSKTEQKENSGNSKNNTDKTETDGLDSKKITYKEYQPDNMGMKISLPSEMYILTPDIKENDPALVAANITKDELKKNFTANGTILKAFAKDFSFDITLTMTQSEKTQTIDNLSSLSEDEIAQITDALLENDFVTGCSKNTYNGTLFLTFDTEYKTADTTIYGVQEYTIVNGKNIIITFQSHTGKLTENEQTIIKDIMTKTTFEGREVPVEISDAASTIINELDPRYIVILISSIVGLVALASIIIVGTSYRRSHKSLKNNDDEEFIIKTPNDDEKFIIKTPKTRIQVDDEPADEIKINDNKKTYDTSIFEASDENVLFKNKKLDDEKKQREKNKTIPRLDATTELSIPKNPYTPVGKAEAVEQPAMSVTSEIAKLSNISAEEAKAAKEAVIENKSDIQKNPDAVVFAESTPKAKTEIKQIGEDVLNTEEDTDISDKTYEESDKVTASVVNNPYSETNVLSSDIEKKIITNNIAEENEEQQPEEELSEYEKRFGKGRKIIFSNSSSTEIQEEKNVSKFEKHFGKLQPAVTKKDTTNDTTAAVDDIIKHEDKVADVSDVKENKTNDNLIKDDSAIKITKAPPKISQPVITDQPVLRITKTTPMPTTAKEQIEKSQKEVTEVKEKTEKTDNIQTPNTKITKEQPLDTNVKKEQPERKTILQKFTDKLFATEDYEETTESIPETNKESTNKFINSIKDKLKYRAPEYEEESIDQTPKTNNDGTEIYRSTESVKSNQIELAVKKNDDGSIVIDSISDKTGKPVQIAIKDGNSESKAKAEYNKKKNKKSKKKDKKSNKNKESSSAVSSIGSTIVKGTEAVSEAALKSAKNISDKAEAADAVISATIGTAAEHSVKTKAVDDVKTANKQDKKTADDVKTEKKQDVKTADDVKTEIKQNEKTVDEVKTKNKQDIKTADDVKTEIKQNKKTVDDVKTEIKQDEKTADDVKTEKKQDVKTADDVKTEKKQDVKTADDVKTEIKQNEKTADDVKTENKQDEKTADDVKTENKQDEKTADDVKTEKKQDEKTVDDVKTEIKQNEKTADDVKPEIKQDKKTVDDVKTEKKQDVKTADDVKTEKKQDVKTADDVKTEIKQNEKTVDEVKTENKQDIKTVDDVKTEIKQGEKTVDEVKTEIKQDVKTVDEVKTEDKQDEKTADDVKTEIKQDEKTVDEVKTEIKQDVKTVDEVKTEDKQDEKTADTIKTKEETIEKSDYGIKKQALENKINIPENKSETDILKETKEVIEIKQNSIINNEPEIEHSALEFVFERDTGIIFERAISPADNLTGTITPLTSIPKLESVNANDYNKQAEEMRKQSAVKFNIQPEVQPEIIQTPIEEEQESYYPNNEDDTLDPFAPGSGEMTLKEIDKKTAPKLRDRLKRSFGKIFSAGEDEK